MKKFFLFLFILAFLIVLQLSYIQWRLKQKFESIETRQFSISWQLYGTETAVDVALAKMTALKSQSRMPGNPASRGQQDSLRVTRNCLLASY